MNSFLSAASTRTMDAALAATLNTSVPNFQEWCVSRDIDASAVVFTHSAAEAYGLEAARDLPANAPVITVPLAAAIMQNGAETGSLEPTHALALTLCLATQVGPDLTPWLSLWPSAGEGAWRFSPEDWASLSWCQEAMALHSAEKSAARQAYDEKIAPHVPTCPSWERFVWALSMVGSRAAGVNMSGVAADGGGTQADRRLAIIPLVDLLNHRVTPTTCLTYDPSGGGAGTKGGAFVVRTIGPVSKGAALSICYGDKENAELLVAYGFALARNPSDTAGLRVPIAPDDPLRMIKMGTVPRPMLELYQKCEEGNEVMGALRWARLDDDRDADGRPVDEGAVRLEPSVDPSLEMLVGIAAATSMGDVMGAMMAGRGAPQSTWPIVQRACNDALAGLPTGESVRDAGLRVALQARRVLLEAAAAMAAREAESGGGMGGGDEEMLE